MVQTSLIFIITTLYCMVAHSIPAIYHVVAHLHHRVCVVSGRRVGSPVLPKTDKEQEQMASSTSMRPNQRANEKPSQLQHLAKTPERRHSCACPFSPCSRNFLSDLQNPGKLTPGCGDPWWCSRPRLRLVLPTFPGTVSSVSISRPVARRKEHAGGVSVCHHVPPLGGIPRGEDRGGKMGRGI